MATAHFSTPAGEVLLAASGTALTGLWFAGQKHFARTLPRPLPPPEDDSPAFAAVKRWLTAYFAGKRPTPSELELAPEGTPFQLAVWRVLTGIPYGTVLSYGEVAQEAARLLGRPTCSARAAGVAVGRNPISIVIPCHRVIGADGSLTGYAGGLERKTALLNLEGVDLRDPFRHTPVRVRP
jgi:methylated-DNA-[protein]-cysteine S-methyltransferase